jgi:hypothetical protein
MEISLRLGVFRDRQVLEKLAGPMSIVVPAHIAAYARDGLWGFLRGLAESQFLENPPFLYDPMSYWLDVPTEFWSKGSDAGRGEALALPIDDVTRIRPAFLALLEAYGMVEAVQSVDSPVALRAAFLEGGVKLALDFQRQGSEPTKKKTVDKYALILNLPLEATGMTPRHLVAPYFSVTELSDRGVAEQAALNRAALSEQRPGESMWSVLALDSHARLGPLSEALRGSLSLDRFDGIGIWVSNLDEHDARLSTLAGYRSLIASVGRPVWVMYGGYFALLLGPEGVVNVSHGIYYTESKRMRGPVGSGPAPERYYIPALHRFYPPAVAFRFLGLLPDLRCECPECNAGLPDLVRESAAASSAPAARMAWIRRLQRHFLYCRAAEVEAVNTRPRKELVETLLETAARVDELAPSQLAALGVSSNHLRSWATVLGQ